jgi:hypothetical protein
MEQEFSMKLTVEILQKMVRSVLKTKPDEIDCDECFTRVDAFVELELQGKNADEAMPLVKDHLERCQGCREEFEALLDCIRATTEPE